MFKKEMIEDAKLIKEAGEIGDWDTYYELKDKWDLSDGEGYWELMKRAANAPD